MRHSSYNRSRIGRAIGHNAALVVVAAMTAVLGGCNGPAYEYDSVVTGTVTVDGELAKSGTLIFHPVDGGPTAIGRIYPDGSYSLRTGQGDMKQSDGGTVKSGDYVITAVITGPPEEQAVIGQGGPPVAGPMLIAEKYTSVESSDLKRTVKPGENIFVFDLEQATPPEETKPTDGVDVEPETESASQSEPKADAPTESESAAPAVPATTAPSKLEEETEP